MYRYRAYNLLDALEKATALYCSYSTSSGTSACCHSCFTSCACHSSAGSSMQSSGSQQWSVFQSLYTFTDAVLHPRIPCDTCRLCCLFAGTVALVRLPPGVRRARLGTRVHSRCIAPLSDCQLVPPRGSLTRRPHLSLAYSSLLMIDKPDILFPARVWSDVFNHFSHLWVFSYCNTLHVCIILIVGSSIFSNITL